MNAQGLKEALQGAQREGRALLAANFYNLETLQGILKAAAERKKSVILQLTRSSIEYMGLNTAVALARTMTYEYEVRTWLHLDHGDSMELVQQCLDAGFDSVMIDASEKSLDENVDITRNVVELASKYNACVEAELGYVAKLGQSTERVGFTEPEDARRFVEETGVDALAVAIGSAHGFYKQEPKLDIERLKKIRKATGIPLVLHGGSGIPERQLKEAIKAGICKINVATETKNAFMQSIKREIKETEEIDLRRVFPKGIEAVKEMIGRKIEIVSRERVEEEAN